MLFFFFLFTYFKLLESVIIQYILLSFAEWDAACLGFIHIHLIKEDIELPTKAWGACATNTTQRLTLTFLDTHERTHGSLLYLQRHLILTPPNFLSCCCLPKCHCFCCITMGTAVVPSVPILPPPITFLSPKFAAKTF